MYDFLQSILGVYSPPTYTDYRLVDGVIQAVEVIPNGSAGVDWLFVLSGVAFIVVVFAVLRIIGGVLTR